MKKIFFVLGIFGILFSSCNENKQAKTESLNAMKITEKVNIPKEVEFPSLDGLMITANVYEINKEAPVLLLCHQARFNKFEYESIAEKLNERGFNCIAIDQRSGGPIVDRLNQTSIRAIKANKSTDYVDAEQDILAAIDYAAKRYGKPVTLWGSSYSSTLAMYIGQDNKNVNGVIAFSPGNYLAEKKGSLIDKLKDFTKPLFVTSSKDEAPTLKKLIKNIELNSKQICFEPKEKGYHGSKALWPSQPDGEEYWEAIDSFLEMVR